MKSIPEQATAAFTTHYGADGSGDLYLDENNQAFCAAVNGAAKDGVDLVVADGGFSVVGDEEHQEEHSKQLLVAQILAMFRVLKKGGNFVVKLFDLLTDFSVELVYLLYLYFERISICKPFSSRPANSERYLVCLNLQEARPKDLIQFLATAARELAALKPSSLPAKSGHVKHQPGFVSKQEKIDLGLLDMTHLLSADMVAKDEYFMDAIEGSNMRLADAAHT
ncbi:FtsJ methyltransferase domain-containing protein 2 [Kappamyces sp. JEL0680]|nr:FtsJ methyltransferase domain-containing protein 2 [Kappamyces sp. JEL0680]